MIKFLLKKRDATINHIPPTLTVHVTLKCNLRCPTCCYLLESPDNLGGGFIKVDDFEKMINQYANIIEVCGLSGGEALLHPNIGKLMDITARYNIRTNLSTNGILIKDKIDILKAHPMNVVNVSLDSYDYETFAVSRGGTRSQFNNIVEGLRLLRKNRIGYFLSFMISTKNISEIDDMIDFAYQVEPNTVNLFGINPHGDSKYGALTTDNKEVINTLDNIVKKADYPFNISLPVIFDTQSSYFKSAKCSQPWNNCLVNYNGDIDPCCQLINSKGFGNMFEGYKFNSSKMREFRKNIMDGNMPEPCTYCEIRFLGEEYGLFDCKSKKWILD
jgi:radical SAM protein with 4Fe4S-binding SPASM domain